MSHFLILSIDVITLLIKNVSFIYKRKVMNIISNNFFHKKFQTIYLEILLGVYFESLNYNYTLPTLI